MKVSELLSMAGSLGACDKSGKATDWKSVCWLFFTPQGREFCAKHNFPSLESFRLIKEEVLKYGVYVDSGGIKLSDVENIALVGDTSAELTYSGADVIHRVILMHGAKAVIHASRYAVISVLNISGSYEVVNDGTARVLRE